MNFYQCRGVGVKGSVLCVKPWANCGHAALFSLCLGSPLERREYSVRGAVFPLFKGTVARDFLVSFFHKSPPYEPLIHILKYFLFRFQIR
jgi:hypothetical protein